LTNADRIFIANLISLVEENRLVNATKWYIGLTFSIYKKTQGLVPRKFIRVLSELKSSWSTPRVMLQDKAPPYKCDTLTLMRTLKEKYQEKIFRKSLIDQLVGSLHKDFISALLTRILHEF